MAKQSLEEKVLAIAPELVDAAQSMSIAELRSAITDRAMLYSASRDAEKSDHELTQAKDAVKELREPYAADQKAALTVIAWASALLESRGK